MKFYQLILTATACALLSACTEPGETTAVGAATGGVIGAGLGAIVGNQTGSTGAGLVLGSVAGAAAGAAVGNAIEGQEEAIRTQDEALERQENLLAAQKAEIRELRQLGQDSVSFRGGERKLPAGNSEYNGAPVRGSYRGWQPVQPENPAPALQEKNLLADQSQSGAEPVSGDSSLVNTEPAAAETLEDSGRYAGQGSAECLQADDEARSALSMSSPSDKLLHLRRALRLCPGRAALHVSLGRVYLGLSRRADAEFEYKEALRLDPASEAARSSLAALSSENQ
jgi:tetratricopeptide (TPR) repeat protein